MAYGYETNKEFIDKSSQLLEKLEEKGLWDKDTLVIGLDKSVRPLLYTLRKLSLGKGLEAPDTRFFNYSSLDYCSSDYVNNLVLEKLRKDIGSRKEFGKTKNPENYRKILVLDDCVWKGDTFVQTNEILKKFIKDFHTQPEIYFSALSSTKDSFYDSSTGIKKEIVRADDKNIGHRDQFEVGVEDITGSNTGHLNITNPIWKTSEKELVNRYGNWEKFSPESKEELLKKSAEGKKIMYSQMFLPKRYQLSSDIKNYLHEKNPEKVQEKNKRGLEIKIISGMFVFLLLCGLFLRSTNLTGNVVVNSITNENNFLVLLLILIGIGGFFAYRKLKNNVLNK